jgi:hypothetical protein
MKAVALSLVLLLPLSARSQDAPTIKLPAELKIQPATISELKAETTGKHVKWVVLTPGLSTRACESGRTLLVSGPPGRYELLAYTAAGDVPSEAARCVVVISKDDKKEDDKTPPIPPKPKPPDELRKRLSAAIAADKATSADVLQLAAVYRESVKVVNDAELPSSKELLRRLREVSASLLTTPDAMTTVRELVAMELASLLGPPSDEVLTVAQRKLAAELFNRLSTTLEELSK